MELDCHSAAGSGDDAGSGCGSIDWMVPDTFADSLAADWCAGEHFLQKLALEPSSSLPPSPCAYYQSR